MNERPRDSKGQDPEDPERKPGIPPHQPPPKGDREESDEDAKESFPSSDPPSTGGPGV